MISNAKVIGAVTKIFPGATEEEFDDKGDFSFCLFEGTKISLRLERNANKQIIKVLSLYYYESKGSNFLWNEETEKTKDCFKSIDDLEKLLESLRQVIIVRAYAILRACGEEVGKKEEKEAS